MQYRLKRSAGLRLSSSEPDRRITLSCTPQRQRACYFMSPCATFLKISLGLMLTIETQRFEKIKFEARTHTKIRIMYTKESLYFIISPFTASALSRFFILSLSTPYRSLQFRLEAVRFAVSGASSLWVLMRRSGRL